MAIRLLIICLFLMGCNPPPKAYQWQLPEGFPVPIVPIDNPMSEAKVALGRRLFYDKNLSFNQQQSCSSCHIQEHAFAERQATSVGTAGHPLKRNSLALVNVAYNGSFTWAHNNLDSIEKQILIPMFSEAPIELGITGHEVEILSRLNSGQYSQAVYEAFDVGKLNFKLINQVLASFVRSLISLNSPFDHYAYKQDDLALSSSQIRGMNLFFSERMECFHCHGGFNFTQSSKHDQQGLDLNPFHNTGLYNVDGQGSYPANDQGLFDVTFRGKDRGRFRAPTLRNIEFTAPYMHDGSITTLSDVIDFYAAGGSKQGKNSPLKSVFVPGFDINDEEKQDLVNFLLSLSDPEFINNPNFGPPMVED